MLRITIKECVELNQETGSVYRKCASRTLTGLYAEEKKRTPAEEKNQTSAERKKQVYDEAYFGTFSELEYKTGGIAHDIAVIAEAIYENAVYYLGKGRAFDLEKFTEWCIHGGEEEKSLEFQKTRRSLEESDCSFKIIFLNDVMIQAMDALYEIDDWLKVDFSELEVLEPVLKPLLKEFGITADEFNSLKSCMKELFERMIPQVLGKTA